MKAAMNIALGMLIAVLVCAVAYVGIAKHDLRLLSPKPETTTANNNIETELARLTESIRQMKVVKEENFLRRDIMEAQRDIRELTAALPKVPPVVLPRAPKPD